MSDALTKEEIDDLADRWYKALDVHAPVDQLHAMMLDQKLAFDEAVVHDLSPTTVLLAGADGAVTVVR